MLEYWAFKYTPECKQELGTTKKAELTNPKFEPILELERLPTLYSTQDVY